MNKSIEKFRFTQTIERNLTEFKREIIKICNEYLQGSFNSYESEVTMKEAMEKRTDKLAKEINLIVQWGNFLEDKREKDKLEKEGYRERESYRKGYEDCAKELLGEDEAKKFLVRKKNF